MRSSRLDAGGASKLAGKFSFAATVALDRVGRAFIKPVETQAKDPMALDRASPSLTASALWFLRYLQIRKVFRDMAPEGIDADDVGVERGCGEVWVKRAVVANVELNAEQWETMDEGIRLRRRVAK